MISLIDKDTIGRRDVRRNRGLSDVTREMRTGIEIWETGGKLRKII